MASKYAVVTHSNCVYAFKKFSIGLHYQMLKYDKCKDAVHSESNVRDSIEKKNGCQTGIEEHTTELMVKGSSHEWNSAESDFLIEKRHIRYILMEFGSRSL